MKIFIGADHAGFELKGKLIPFLKELGHDVEDLGPDVYRQDDDYPDYIRPVAEKVSLDESAKGVVLDKSGQGNVMCANRVKRVRAAVYYGGNLEIVRLSRQHNDSNILSIGAAFVSLGEAKEAVRLFLETPFSGDERHVRRIKKLDA